MPTLTPHERNIAALTALPSRRLLRQPNAWWPVRDNGWTSTIDGGDVPPIGHHENELTVTGYAMGVRRRVNLAVKCDCGSPEFLLARKDGSFVFAPCPRCTPPDTVKRKAYHEAVTKLTARRMKLNSLTETGKRKVARLISQCYNEGRPEDHAAKFIFAAMHKWHIHKD